MKIRKVELPKDKYQRKCPYTMTNPIYVTIHNTWNTATASQEIAYMQSNDKAISFHWAVDEKEAVQGIPMDRNAWHAGDGTYGKGNRRTIAIEIARSRSPESLSNGAEDNGAILTAMLLKQFDLTVDDVVKHQDWSGKYCPHRILDEKGWATFLNKVEDEYQKLSGVKTEVQPAVIKEGSFKVKVTALNGVNIRENPTTDADIEGLTYHNEVYTIDKTTTGKGAKEWGHLENGQGWIALDYTTRLIENQAKPTIKPEVVRVTASTLNIRQQPNLSGKIVGAITDKGAYAIVEKQEADSYVWGRLKSGSGWIALKYTTSTAKPAEVQKQSGIFKFNTTVNVRELASTASRKITTYQPNQTVNIRETLISGGYLWGKYLGGSGKWRFVALGKVGGTQYGEFI